MEDIFERLGDSIVVGYPAPPHLVPSRRWTIPAFSPLSATKPCPRRGDRVYPWANL